MGLCLESGSEVLRREESEIDDCWSVGWLVMTCDMEEKCRLDDSRIALQEENGLTGCPGQ